VLEIDRHGICKYLPTLFVVLNFSFYSSLIVSPVKNFILKVKGKG